MRMRLGRPGRTILVVQKSLKFDLDGRTLAFPTPPNLGDLESWVRVLLRTHDALKQCTKQIAVSKSFMPVLRKKSNDPVPGRLGQTAERTYARHLPFGGDQIGVITKIFVCMCNFLTE